MATERKIEGQMKYRLSSPDGADRYLVAPELSHFKPAGQVRVVQIEDRYVDSADWALTRAGFSARLRRTSRETTIVLKRQATPDGPLPRREELEGPADQQQPPQDWPASPARSVVLELCGDAPLVELLTIRQMRRVRRLEHAETKVDLSVDEVEVLLDGRTVARFDELEVELDAGPDAPLAALGELLDRDRGLRRSTRSKLDRAVRAIVKALPSMPEEVHQHWLEAPPALLGGRRQRSRAEARTAGGPSSNADADGAAADADGAAAGDSDTAEVAARRRLAFPANRARLARRGAPGPARPGRPAGRQPARGCPQGDQVPLRQDAGKEKGTRDGSDVEDLHDMRVATRRIRAAWRVFDDAFKPGKTRKLRRHLRTIADRLGAVRDLDVLIEELEAYRLGLDPDQQPGLEPLLALWRRQRGSARDLLIAEMDSGRYGSFIEEMKEFLDAGANEAATVASPTLPHRVRDRAPSQIWAAYEAVRAYELVLPWADVETLHQLRIATKWLRYDLEFFGETLGSDAARLLDRVVALQDYLGCLNDADVAARLTRDILVSRSGELSRAETDAIGAYLHSRERELARRRRALGPVWRAVAGAPFRRALGRATASL